MNPRLQIQERIEGLSEKQREFLAGKLKQIGVRGDGEFASELVAWVVADGAATTDQKLRREMSRRLPARLIPRRFIRVDSIPRTANGKLDRNRLVDLGGTEQSTRQHSLTVSSETEIQLIQICQRLLRATNVSPQDNFFHIGGDSLLSIQLISLARQVGLEIEPRDLLRCESIAELAAASDQRTGQVTKPEPTSTTDEPVISRIRASSTDGSVLLVHEVGGRCHYAHYLAAELAPEYDLYVSNQPPPELSPTSIESLATLYADAWLEVPSAGPRILVAFCWGGLLAYEIARQLKQRGNPIDAILIVESGTEAAYRHAPALMKAWDRIKGLVIRSRNRAESLTSPSEFGHLVRSLVAKLLRRDVEPITADAGFQFRDDEGDPEQIRSNVQAFLDYEIAPNEMEFHLFRVGGKAGLIGTRYSNRSLGWQYLVRSRLRLHSIPGTHDTCMQPPHVDALAAQMNTLIQDLR